MGELIADAMLAATSGKARWSLLMNGGGVRAAFEAGDITFGSAIAVQPFNNTLVVMDLTGAQLMQSIERYRLRHPVAGVIWVSTGSSYILEASKAAGSRVSNLTIAGKPVNPTATYRIVTNNFMADGGDGIATIKASAGYRYDTGALDIDALVDYLTSHTPLVTRSRKSCAARN